MIEKFFATLKFLWLFLFALIVVASSVKASERKSAISLYEDNYFISGNGKENNQVKGQISIKYALVYPYNIGLYMAYTDAFWWNIYDKSSPFREHNYKPELFFRWDKESKWWLSLFATDYLQGGIGHKSNGRDGPESKSIDYYYYWTAQHSAGEKINIGFNYKIRKLKRISDNFHIKKYWGRNVGCFIQSGDGSEYIDKERLSYNYEFGTDYGKHVVTVECRILTTKFQPFLFAIYEHGYGVDGLIDYDKKGEYFKIGLKLK